jgi:predicted small lipoprotein YifL
MKLFSNRHCKEAGGRHGNPVGQRGMWRGWIASLTMFARNDGGVYFVASGFLRGLRLLAIAFLGFCLLTACGLKRNLQLPDKNKQNTEQTDQSAPVPAPDSAPPSTPQN